MNSFSTWTSAHSENHTKMAHGLPAIEVFTEALLQLVHAFICTVQ